MLLHGIFPPITTPFYPDGNVYFKKLESNVERYSRTPVAGIVVLGSTGEAIMLSDQERRDVFKAAMGAAAPGPPQLRCPMAAKSRLFLDLCTIHDRCGFAATKRRPARPGAGGIHWNCWLISCVLVAFCNCESVSGRRAGAGNPSAIPVT